MKIDKKVTLIVDLQFGSTGKGKVAGYIANKLKPDFVISANMPNAGHTFVSNEGERYVHKVMPNGIISTNPELKIGIGSGSVFSVKQLQSEISNQLLYSESDILGMLKIHENSTILKSRHIRSELNFGRIGSTQQGCSGAIIERLQRYPNSNVIARDVLAGTKYQQCLVSQPQWLKLIAESKTILAEGAQGYDLGISNQFYPYCTSRDCTPARIFADMGIPISLLRNIVGVLRPYPIRVAGTSGGVYADQTETSWEQLGLKPEYTTVTKKVRRVFTFSNEQIKNAIDACCPTHLVLNFADYLTPKEQADLVNMVNNISSRNECPARVELLGIGEKLKDVIELVDDPLTIPKVFK